MANHKWTGEDDVIAYFLYKFGEKDLIFDIDGIAIKLGMSKDSLTARKGNFKYLETGKGLSHVAGLSERIYNEFHNVTKKEYLAVVKKILYPKK
ncbi:MAG: hypothetical protein K8S18_01960 [Desulfobacula sp.]|nr:hypothetical protein [Desulfobacula sp.]